MSKNIQDENSNQTFTPDGVLTTNSKESPIHTTPEKQTNPGDSSGTTPHAILLTPPSPAHQPQPIIDTPTLDASDNKNNTAPDSTEHDTQNAPLPKSSDEKESHGKYSKHIIF